MTCLQLSCNVPKRLSNNIKCLKTLCATDCTEDIYGENCQQCKNDKCTRKGKDSNTGSTARAPKQAPLAIVDKV